MNTRSKGFLILLAILLLAIPTIATLVTPTTYHRGALIYAEFWDFHGEVGARNGSMENVSIENATNVNSSNLNVSSKFYVNTSGAIYSGTYNSSPILQDYLDARLLKDSNNSILVKQKVDSCTAANDALGWNGTGLNCKTISSSVTNGTGINVTGSVVSQILSFWNYDTHFEGYAVNNGWQIYDNYTTTYTHNPGDCTAVNANLTGHKIYLRSGVSNGRCSATFNTTDTFTIDTNPLIVNVLVNYSNGTTTSSTLFSTTLIGMNDTFPHRLSESTSRHVGFYLNGTGWYTVLADDDSAKSNPISQTIGNGTLLTFEVNSSRARYWVNGVFVREYLGTADTPTQPLSIGAEVSLGTGTASAPNQLWIDYMSIKKFMGS